MSTPIVRPTTRHRLALLTALALLLSVLPAPVVAQSVPAIVDAASVGIDLATDEGAVTWDIVSSGGAWEVSVSGPAEVNLELIIEADDGTRLDRTRGVAGVVSRDLAMVPGRYRIVVSGPARDQLPLTIETRASEAAFDAEPNDEPATAMPIGIGSRVTGRLADDAGDIDHFRLPSPLQDELLDIVFEDPSSTGRTVCLLDEDGRDRHCRNGAGSLLLGDLALEPRDHVLRVRGSSDPAAPYTLEVVSAGKRRLDREAEPNDDARFASAFDVALGVEGRSAPDDRDFHLVTIEGEPQLWRVEASGPDIRELAWVDGGGAPIEHTLPPAAGEPAMLTDLLLGPGGHRFLVRTTSGDYRLAATPLGPPDPDAEREPNSEEFRAETIRVGDRRVGRIATRTDVDHFRVTIAAPQNMRLRVVPPADGEADVRVFSGGTELVRQPSGEPGAPVELELGLLPGDHLIRVGARVPSDGEYELTLERMDPGTVNVDLAPNDRSGFARPIPSTLTWSGDDGSDGSDRDWYELPSLPRGADVVFEVDGGAGLRLWAGPDARDRITLDVDDEGRATATDVPADVPLAVEVDPSGPYTITFVSDALTPAPPPADLELTAELGFETDTVAAYRPEAQLVAGVLELTNAGLDPVRLELEPVTSDVAWRASVDPATVALDPGSSAAIDVEVSVDPDVWADIPVAVSVIAREPAGGHVTATREVVAVADAAPLGPSIGFRVPDALLGGLNVAGAALGAIPAGDVHADRELLLYDGLSPAGGGFGVGFDAFPAELTVDLAGEGPIPIAGTIINPLARGSLLHETPDEFELLLSTDGASWTPVLRDRITPWPVDQAFVLPEPVEATHARLRVYSLHAGTSRTLGLGEWKVIAVPGVEPDGIDRNVAARAKGGRVLRRIPASSGWEGQAIMVEADGKRRVPAVDKVDPRFEAVIGFRHGRAALVESLRWVDVDDSDPEARMDSVEVAISTDSPLGPWQELGTWSLDRGVGAPEYVFDDPRWVRYLRVGTALPEGTRATELPSLIEVHEQPAGDRYRSVIGEWGQADRVGPLEWLVPPTVAGAEALGDAADTRLEATPLTPGIPRPDRATILEDVDWYRVDVPDTANTVSFEVTGLPQVGVGLTLVEAAGAEIPLQQTLLSGGAVRYEAAVEPGSSVALLVEQLPFNVVFAFDTSGSMGPFLQTVMEGVREFAADVVPGRESVMVQPFVPEDPLLSGWTDDPWRLVDAVNAYDPRENSSSAAVESMMAANTMLVGREGLRAILIVTDAETGGLDKRHVVWDGLESVRPVVYSVHIGSSGRNFDTGALMESWAHANGGRYAYPTTHAEVQRAFERMSTQLRRPTTYELLAETSSVDRSPATLRVDAPPDVPAALAPGVGVEIILDTSGSMRQKLGGQQRIAIAKTSLRRLFSDVLDEGVPVALRTFGGRGKGKAARCDTRLTRELSPLDRAATLKLVKGLKAVKKTKTPIAAAIEAVADDLIDVTGPRIVVLVTDGDETCGGDPAVAITALRVAGIDVNVNIVGFALDDDELKARMAGWAELGEGSYFDAEVADELAASLAQALAAPYRVYGGDETGPIGGGTVGDGGIELDPGIYRVEVLTDPPVEFTDVQLPGGVDVSLTLPLPEEGAAGS